jgi:hypothetical protein
MTEEEEKKEYDETLDGIMEVIEDRDRDAIIPALVCALSRVMDYYDMPKTVLMSFVADSFDMTEEERNEHKRT